jgi:hypothetical protein
MTNKNWASPYKTVSQIIESWQKALKEHGDLPVIVDYDSQYYWSPMAEQFRVEEGDGVKHFYREQ